MNPWGGGGAGAGPGGRVLMGLTSGAWGSRARGVLPHSSFVVRNQETDAGEPALGLMGRPGRPGWLQGDAG